MTAAKLVAVNRMQGIRLPVEPLALDAGVSPAMGDQMTQVRLGKGRSWWAPIVALLGIASVFALQSADRAQAAEYKYCWGKELNGGLPLCIGSSAGSTEYIYTVYANGMGGAICAGVGFNEPAEQAAGCTKVANEGVWVENIGGMKQKPFIYTKTPEKNVVYGKFWDGPATPQPTWHYDSLGGATIADPDIASDGENLAHVFVEGTENHLWQKYWNGSSWSGWENISATFGGKIAGGPGAVSMGPGRLDVVARMPDNTVGHWWYEGVWHYDNLGGSIAGDPDIASDANGHLNVFVKGGDGNLYQKWWTGSGWSAWQNLSWFGGGTISGGPGAVSWGPNRFDVVARMPDSSVGHWYYDGATWHYDNLGGAIINDPDIASNLSGNLNVFAQDTSGNLVQKWWTTFSGVWSGWQNLSWFGGGTIASGPGAVSWSAKRFDVAARMPGNGVGHWWYG